MGAEEGPGGELHGEALSKLTETVERLARRLDAVERRQDEQHLLVMKFVVVRSMSTLALLVEQSAAPPRLMAEAQERVSEVAQQIARAKDLDEVRALDMELQDHLRALIGAFKGT